METATSTPVPAGTRTIRRIAALAAVLTLPAWTAHAQYEEASPRRWSAAVTWIHPGLRPGLGGSMTWDAGSLRLQFDYTREVERLDEFYGERSVRTLQWFAGAVSWNLPGTSRMRPHVLAGAELLTDSTDSCAILRRRGGDCTPLAPHRRPGLHGGLGLDAPLGTRFFARVQYLTSVVYVYERFGVGHRLRVGAGVRF